MKGRICRMLAMMLLCMASVSYSEGPVENMDRDEYIFYAVTAGKADALLLKAGDAAFLIDTGYTRSRGKILYAMDLLGMDHLDGVFVTHTDKDHTDGLEWLARSDLRIDAWYAPALYTGVSEKKHPAVQAAGIRDEEVTWLRAGDSFLLGEATLEVLAPGTCFDDKDDNNSLVMMLHTPYGRILFCGDMEYSEERWLLNRETDLRCDVIKIPNHADDDVCTSAFINACSPTVAVISTDTAEKPETPDPKLMKRLAKVCQSILQTQDTSGGIRISLEPEGIRTAYVALPEARQDITITAASAEDGTVTLRNTGTETADLSGWYMLTEKKEALFVFPEGTVLAAGQSMTIGSAGKKGTADFRWDEKKPFNQKKEDSVTLYDRYGNTVDEKSCSR